MWCRGTAIPWFTIPCARCVTHQRVRAHVGRPRSVGTPPVLKPSHSWAHLLSECPATKIILDQACYQLSVILSQSADAKWADLYRQMWTISDGFWQGPGWDLRPNSAETATGIKEGRQAVAPADIPIHLLLWSRHFQWIATGTLISVTAKHFPVPDTPAEKMCVFAARPSARGKKWIMVCSKTLAAIIRKLRRAV